MSNRKRALKFRFDRARPREMKEHVRFLFSLIKMSQKRVARTSMKQFEMLLNFMENHQQLVSGKLEVNFTIRDRQRLWEELSEKLNAAGNGSRKDAEKWRKVMLLFSFYLLDSHKYDNH